MTETEIDLGVSVANLLMLFIVTVSMIKVYVQGRQVSKLVQRSSELAAELVKMDRHFATQIAVLAKGISTDVSSLKRLQANEPDDEVAAQHHS